jgi:hypothetical protein
MQQSPGNLYEILVKEPIDPSWSDWLNDFAISRTEEKETRITGRVIDQTALYGLLNILRDLNLTLICVKKVA